MLQQPLDTRSARGGLGGSPHSDGSSVVAPVDYSSKPVTLNLSLRRGRLAVVAVVMIAGIVSATLVFRAGVEIKRFHTVEMVGAEKTSMVDTYNSYTGYLTTALGKPLELFVTTTVQVVALQLLATLILAPEPSWKATLVTLVASTCIGYLVSNAFNAMNVQARDMDVQPVISASDLTAADFANKSYANMTSSVQLSRPEATPRNPSTNTVLRNLVLPRVFKRPLTCTISSNSTLVLQDDAVLYGLSPRDWMKTMLTEAVEAKTLRVVLNPSDPRANANVKTADMPYDASRAAFLLLNTLFLSSQFVPWGQNRTWDDDDDILSPYQTDTTNPDRNVSTAVLAGVLPRDARADEATKRSWFLNNSGAILADRFRETTVTKLTDVAMELTRVDLGHNISFDAMSFEVDVDPARLTSVTSPVNGTRYLNLRSTQCGPWPARCLLAKRDQPPSKPVMSADILFDAPAQVHAFALCLDANGSEALQSTIRQGGAFDDLNVKSCPSTSASAMLLVSVAKRLVADALIQNVSASAGTGTLTPNANASVVVNLRKIYTFTVARLGWQMRNLSAEFGAVCSDNPSNGCRGLTYELKPSEAGTQQKLVVSGDALPAGLLTPPVYSAWASVARQRPIPLVLVSEPPREASSAALVDEAGDVLLPHNIKTITWAPTNGALDGPRLTGAACSMYTEDRLQLVLNNHLYMEQSLQATYTAGTFFLFQKAVVKDVLNATANGGASLKFDQNVAETVVVVSIPTENALLTLGGCLALAAGVLVVFFWPRLALHRHRQEDPFSDITTAHVIAHVMLDEETFPPLLVERKVVHVVGVDSEKKSPEEDVDKFVIGSVALHPQDANVSGGAHGDTRARATSMV